MSNVIVPISVTTGLAFAEYTLDRAGVDLVLPGDPRREAVLYAIAAAHAVTGRGWSLDRARDGVSVTLPAAGPAFTLLSALPYVGALMAGLAAKQQRTTVYLSPASMRTGIGLVGTVLHERGHAASVKVGSLAWCLAYGLIPEVVSGAEAPCYGAEMAVDVLLGGRDADAVAREALVSLSAYGGEEPLYRGIVESHADMLRDGTDPGGIIAEVKEDLRRCGWQG